MHKVLQDFLHPQYCRQLHTSGVSVEVLGSLGSPPLHGTSHGVKFYGLNTVPENVLFGGGKPTNLGIMELQNYV